MRALSKSLLGLLLSVACVWLVARHIDGKAVWAVLSRASAPILALAVAIYLCAFVARAARWAILLRSSRTFTIAELWPVVMVGYAANNLLPARMGELVRAVALAKRHGLRKTTTLATILMERIFDGLTLLMLLGAMGLAIPLEPWVRRVGWLGLGIFGSALAFLLANVLLPTQGAALVARIRGVMPVKSADTVGRMYDSFQEGIATLRKPGRLAFIVALSLVTWAFEGAYYFSTMQAVGLHLPPHAALLTLIIVSLGTIAPSAPGFIGTFQFACVTALGAYAIGRETALGYAIVLHIAQYVPVTLLGVTAGLLGGMDLFGTGDEGQPSPTPAEARERP